MKDPANLENTAFDKLIEVVNSDEFLQIRRDIFAGGFYQQRSLDTEKLREWADKLDLSLAWSTEYKFYIAKGWLRPCYFKSEKTMSIPFPDKKGITHSSLKHFFFHPYRILEVANCSANSEQIRNLLMIWWRRRKNKREGVSFAKKIDKMLSGLYEPYRIRSLVELGIVLEPIFRPQARGSLVLHNRVDYEAHDNWVEATLERLKNLTSGFDNKDWKRLHEKACSISNLLDENSELKTLITLMRNEEQDRLKGRLKVALIAREIAQLIRYFAESQNVELAEEQFSEHATYTNAYFKHSKGSRKIIDGPRVNQLKFVRGFGIDFSSRVRVYVEGATEQSCFYSILSLPIPLKMTADSGAI